LDPIVCTTDNSQDDIIYEIATGLGAKVFRGAEKNKLKRWNDCCDQFDIEEFHTVDCDDPFFDPEEVKRSFALLRRGGYDVVVPTQTSSSGGAIMGYSLTRNIVNEAVSLTKTNEDTEMMWYWLDKVKGVKKITLPEINKNPIKARLTLDYEEDYWLLCSMVNILGNTASRKEVENFLKVNPDFYKINWFRNQEWADGQKAKAP
tara:strand:+ start:7236 stop:7847 length:612 start_codon:yes stop_codon:yes gene_type:complete